VYIKQGINLKSLGHKELQKGGGVEDCFAKREGGMHGEDMRKKKKGLDPPIDEERTNI